MKKAQKGWGNVALFDGLISICICVLIRKNMHGYVKTVTTTKSKKNSLKGNVAGIWKHATSDTNH